MNASVALCTLNGERYLPEQLASILGQDVLPDELVVCDDGSTDATITLLERFRDRASFPVHLHRNVTRLGVTANFEQAVQRCSGDIILLCDQDDIWSPRRVSTTVAAFRADPEAVLAFSDAWLVDRRGRRLRPRLWDVIDLGPTQRARLRRDPFAFVLGRPAMTGCTLAIRASNLDLLLPFPAERSEADIPILHDWWISLALAATSGSGRMAMIEEPLVSYRLHPDQRIGLPDFRLRRVLPRWLQRLGNARVPLVEQRRRLSVMAEVLDELDRRLDAEGMTQVRSASAHLAARADLAGSRLARVRPISHELASGRYHHYGRGMPAAVADLVRVAR